MGLCLELQMCSVLLFYLRVVNCNVVCIMPYRNVNDEPFFKEIVQYKFCSVGSYNGLIQIKLNSTDNFGIDTVLNFFEIFLVVFKVKY